MYRNLRFVCFFLSYSAIFGHYEPDGDPRRYNCTLYTEVTRDTARCT